MAQTVTVLPVKADSHWCPACLRRVEVSETVQRPYRELCHSGSLESCLLQCPTCELVLAAEPIVPVPRLPAAVP